MNMTGFAEIKLLTEEELKEKGWRMVNISGSWIGYHEENRRSIKCGTLAALIKKLSFEYN